MKTPDAKKTWQTPEVQRFGTFKELTKQPEPPGKVEACGDAPHIELDPRGQVGKCSGP